MKSLTETRALFKEPQLLHKWAIEVPQWPSAAAPSNPDVLFMITSSALPEPVQEDAEVELGGFKFNYNGKTNRNGEVVWTFFENTDSDIMEYFFIIYPNARQNHLSNSNITMKAEMNSLLIAPIVLMNLYEADGTTLRKQLQLVNCYFKPSNFGGEFGQATAVQKPTVTVTFDSFVYLKM